MELTVDFYEFGIMIKSILIGKKSDVEKYSLIIDQSQFLERADQYSLDDNLTAEIDTSLLDKYDAIFLVSLLHKPTPVFHHCIKNAKSLYFIDQPELSMVDLEKLEELYGESGALLFPEVIELNHPLVEDFISTSSGRLQYRYTKSLTGKKDVRQALITALGFLSLLSPMPVKKIDVTTFDDTTQGRPSIKLRLKMYDSSVCQIFLDIDNRKEHEITFETSKGKFQFNFAENYIENIHGSKFFIDEINKNILLGRTINSFAMNIILNTIPSFSFRHYLSIVAIIRKVWNILDNSF